MVEQRASTPCVMGSSPVTPAIFLYIFYWCFTYYAIDRLIRQNSNKNIERF